MGNTNRDFEGDNSADWEIKEEEKLEISRKKNDVHEISELGSGFSELKFESGSQYSESHGKEFRKARNDYGDKSDGHRRTHKNDGAHMEDSTGRENRGRGQGRGRGRGIGRNFRDQNNSYRQTNTHTISYRPVADLDYQDHDTINNSRNNRAREK